MPELPEVELAARALDRLVAGRTIAKAELLRPLLARDTTPKDFARLLRGARIDSVGRRGKHLLFHLDNGRVLITHLRMTGRFLYLPTSRPLPKHAHAVFRLENGRKLIFEDQRHFGMMKIVSESELAEAKELRILAPEPLSDEFSAGYLRGVLSKSRRKLKELLLDQTRVTGLGNIYASEVLFIAGINPLVCACDLSGRRVPRLHKAIQEVLRESIDAGSTMNVDPENIDGSYFGGTYEGRWRVYGRESKPCSRCKARIRRVSTSGRSTYFCPRCQSK
jgi:formamidopyrimidine-DNA glycosylase